MSPQLSLPPRTEAEALRDLAERTKADPRWRFREDQKRNQMREWRER